MCIKAHLRGAAETAKVNWPLSPEGWGHSAENQLIPQAEKRTAALNTAEMKELISQTTRRAGTHAAQT